MSRSEEGRAAGGGGGVSGVQQAFLLLPGFRGLEKSGERVGGVRAEPVKDLLWQMCSEVLHEVVNSGVFSIVDSMCVLCAVWACVAECV